jgi:hypothetical protein
MVLFCLKSVLSFLSSWFSAVFHVLGEGAAKSVMITQRVKFQWLHWGGVCGPLFEEELLYSKDYNLSLYKKKRHGREMPHIPSM